MRRRYKIGLFITGIPLICSLFILASYLNYIKSGGADSSIVLVNDGLSVNYLDGYNIDITGDDKEYNFSVTNNNDSTLYYNIMVDNIIIKGDYQYTLTESSGVYNSDLLSFPIISDSLASKVAIESGKTHTYTLKIIASKHNTLKATLSVGVEETSDTTFASTILENNNVKSSSTTKIAEEVATDNEGLIETTIDNGKTYYFRGNVTNNYVSFADFTWRIVSINSDGTVKLVLDDYIDEAGNYYTTSDSSIDDKLNFTNSNLYKTLSSWYDLNLENYANYITPAKYCVDDSVGQVDGNNTYYLGYARLLYDYTQITGCLGTEYNSKIGLLTSDEVAAAGASKNGDNTSFYLYISDKTQSWWTMTPVSSDSDNIVYFSVSQNGLLKSDELGSYYRGIRPTIELVKKIYVSGIGTKEDPYIIKE
jgi:hypothetical protein